MSFVYVYLNQQLVLSNRAQIIFLSGNRTLYPEEIHKNVLLSASPYKIREEWKPVGPFPKNEHEASKFIWDQLDIPKAIRRLPISFVNAEKLPSLQQGSSRPQTIHTIQAWLKVNSNPLPGHCLSVSNNPYIYYQTLTLQNAFLQENLLNKGFTFEGMGNAAKSNIDIALLLDSLARVLYSEVQRKNLTHE